MNHLARVVLSSVLLLAPLAGCITSDAVLIAPSPMRVGDHISYAFEIHDTELASAYGASGMVSVDVAELVEARDSNGSAQPAVRVEYVVAPDDGDVRRRVWDEVISLATATVVRQVQLCPFGPGRCEDRVYASFVTTGMSGLFGSSGLFSPLRVRSEDARYAFSVLGKIKSADYSILADAARGCVDVEVTSSESHPLRSWFAFPFTTIAGAFEFCEGVPLPVRVETPEWTIRKVGYEGGDGASVAWPDRPETLAETPAADTKLWDGIAPPEGEDAVLSVRGAVAWGRENDSRFAKYIDTHPRAILRSTAFMPSGRASTGQGDAAIRSTSHERNVYLQDVDSSEGYRFSVERRVDRFDSTTIRESVTAIESEEASFTPSISTRPSSLVPLSDARSIAESYFSGSPVLETLVSLVNMGEVEFALGDRYVYALRYRAEPEPGSSGALSVSFPYTVWIDATTGSVLLLEVPLDVWRASIASS